MQRIIDDEKICMPFKINSLSCLLNYSSYLVIRMHVYAGAVTRMIQ